MGDGERTLPLGLAQGMAQGMEGDMPRHDGRGSTAARVRAGGGARPRLLTERSAGLSRPQAPARESALVARITAYLRTVPGCYVRKLHGSAFQVGLPDLVGCYRGRFVAIECKKKGGKPTVVQVEELRRITQAGGAACWCDDFTMFLGWWELVKAGAR
jgi:hypothetical protein